MMGTMFARLLGFILKRMEAVSFSAAFQLQILSYHSVTWPYVKILFRLEMITTNLNIYHHTQAKVL